MDSGKNAGRVYLVGAGPGDPGLITVRGLELLRAADVVVHDALVLASLLAEVRDDAEVIDVGKRHAESRLDQEQINALLAEKASAGALVVRLKGGDPYVFGRGAEEAVYLAARGVACEVVAGVTAGLAAVAAAGIPVTHRHYASAVALVTGHEDPDKAEPTADYAALAKIVQSGGTLCLYMAMAKLAQIVAALRCEGLAGDTPAAAVQWGATPQQRSVRTTLAALVDAVREAGVCAPAIVVIGAVAGMDEPGLDAYAARPLFGQRVVITRTRAQASRQRDKLAALGADVLEAPTIEIVPGSADELAKADHAVQHFDRYDWLVLTSVNGVSALAERLTALKLDARHLASVKVAAIGDATAAALRERLAVHADLMPATYVAEALAGALTGQGVAGKRFLLLRADIARKALPELLEQAGAQVDEFAVYQTHRAAALPADVLTALRDRRVDWVTFTSSSTVRNMVDLLGDEKALLRDTKLASIGPITTGTLHELGFEPTVEAGTSNIDGLIAAMVDSSRQPAGEARPGIVG